MEFPKGSADCHVHIFGPFDRYPLQPISEYEPPETPVEALLAMWDALGISRGVIVHALPAGAANQVTLDALRAHRDRLRGVAVIKPEITDARLDEMDEVGFRGVRINLMRQGGKKLYQGGMGMEDLAALAPRLADRGWHAQIWMAAADLAEAWEELEKLPIENFVVDHMGRTKTDAGVDSSGYRALFRLLGRGRWWCKLSGADRNTLEGAPYADTAKYQAALAEANPERVVWGTDWPHVGHSAETLPDVKVLAGLLFDTVTDETVRRRILVDNPAALYGF